MSTAHHLKSILELEQKQEVIATILSVDWRKNVSALNTQENIE